MWGNACRGDFTLITNALAREYTHSEVAAQCQGVDQSGDVIDDMDEEDDDDDDDGGGDEQSERINLPADMPMSSSSSSGAVLPVIRETAEERSDMMRTDDDVEAWEEVGKKKAVSRSKGRR